MKQKMDMLHGPIWNKLPQFALPVAATGILEQLFNASDIAIVGNFAAANRTFTTIMMAYPLSLSTTALLIFIAVMVLRPSKRTRRNPEFPV